MGRYLANGIPTRIILHYNDNVKKTNDEDLKQIKKDLKRYLNINNYNLNIDDQNRKIIFEIDKDFFESNIHNCIKEISCLTLPYIERKERSENLGLYDLNGLSEKEIMKDFSQETYPIHLIKKHDRIYPERYKYVIEENTLQSSSTYHQNYWLYWESSVLGGYTYFSRPKKYSVNIELIQLWADINKYCGEDENYLLYILNNLKTKYYNNPLSKNLIYYIEG